jgi:hypothetical protein
VFTDPNGCSRTVSDSTYVSNVCVGIDDLETSSIMVTPNPAHDWLNISSDDQIIGNVEVLDLLGRIVIELNNSQKVNYVPLDISNLAQGTYLIKIGNSKGRFVKQ